MREKIAQNKERTSVNGKLGRLTGESWRFTDGRWKAAGTIFFGIFELEGERKENKEEDVCLVKGKGILGFMFKPAEHTSY